MLEVDRFNAEDGGVAVIGEDAEAVGPLAIAGVNGQKKVGTRSERKCYKVNCNIPMKYPAETRWKSVGTARSR